MATKRTIISVGGSIIIPKEGFDSMFLKQFQKMIRAQVKKGERFILVIGGGGTCRYYQEGLKNATKTTANDLDWLGIHTTVLNAQFVRFLFQDIAYKEVIQDPTKKVATTKPIIIAAGWKPGWSTDNIAVLHAETHGVEHVMNLSNIAYAYTKDPNRYKDAKRIDTIDWKAFRKIVGNSWDPGKSAPFDPIASASAERLGISVSILDGKNLANVKKAIEGKKFEGTRISDQK